MHGHHTRTAELEVRVATTHCQLRKPQLMHLYASNTFFFCFSNVYADFIPSLWAQIESKRMHAKESARGTWVRSWMSLHCGFETFLLGCGPFHDVEECQISV